MKTPRLERWSIQTWYGQDRATGQVYGREGFPDGHRVLTNVIVEGPTKTTPPTIKTLSGTVYELGVPA